MIDFSSIGLDEDILYHPVTWIFIVAGWAAFVIGFKVAEGGAFGLVASTTDVLTSSGQSWGWPWWQKGMILLAWPVVVYFFMGWKMRR